ncbi:hypothetical protein [Phyllobacterium sp. K27]
MNETIDIIHAGRAATPMISCDTSLMALQALIGQHQDLYAMDELTWDKVAEIEDSPTMRALKVPSVHVGRRLLGRDEDGNDVWQPIHAYSDEEIDHHIDQHLHSALHMCGNREDWKEPHRVAYNAKRAVHKANLAALKEAAKKIEDECGYTAALEAARKTKSLVDDVEKQVLSFVPSSLAAAATLAGFVCSNLDGKAYFDDDAILATLKSIAEASS